MYQELTSKDARELLLKIELAERRELIKSAIAQFYDIEKVHIAILDRYMGRFFLNAYDENELSITLQCPKGEDESAFALRYDKTVKALPKELVGETHKLKEELPYTGKLFTWTNSI